LNTPDFTESKSCNVSVNITVQPDVLKSCSVNKASLQFQLFTATNAEMDITLIGGVSKSKVSLLFKHYKLYPLAVLEVKCPICYLSNGDREGGGNQP